MNKIIIFALNLILLSGCKKEETPAPTQTCKTCYLECTETTDPPSGTHIWIQRADTYCNGEWTSQDSTRYQVNYGAGGVLYHREYRVYCQ